MRKFRLFKQHTKETCAIASLLMVLDAFKKIKYPTKKMEEKLYSIYKDESRGVSPESLIKALNYNGLSSTVYYSNDINLIKRLLDKDNILIIQTEVPQDDTTVTHAVLVYGYNESGLLVADPLSSKFTMSLDDFIKYTDTKDGKLFISVGN